MHKRIYSPTIDSKCALYLLILMIVERNNVGLGPFSHKYDDIVFVSL